MKNLFFLILTTLFLSSCGDSEGLDSLLLGTWEHTNSPCSGNFPDYVFTETTLTKGNQTLEYTRNENDEILVDGVREYLIISLDEENLRLQKNTTCILYFIRK